MRSKIPAEDLLGFVHYNSEVIDADRQGLSPFDESPTAKAEIEQIKAKSAAFNAASEKEYYVELSIGIAPVTLGKDLVISEKLAVADLTLYEEKKKRRTSICKRPV